MNTENIDKIKDLMKEYDFDDIEYNTTHFTGNVSTIIANLLMEAKPPLGIEELVKLMAFLSTCYGNEIEMKSTISNPRKGQMKGWNETMKIKNLKIMFWLNLTVHTLLERMQDGLFEYIFGWEPKFPLVLEIKNEYISSDIEDTTEELGCSMESPFTEPFTDEEIEKIIDYYDNKEKENKKWTVNGKKGRIANRIIEVVKTTNTKENSGLKKTKLYSFAFDIMVTTGTTNKAPYVGKGFSGYDGREKFQHVRNWLTAYEKDKNK